MAFFSKYVKKDDVVIEVGANKGGSTLALSKLAAHVYALEPDPTIFRYLRVFTALTENVSVYNVGAGDVEGKIEYFIGGASYCDLKIPYKGSGVCRSRMDENCETRFARFSSPTDVPGDGLRGVGG